ncbi:MAG: response regulator [Myxococcota bacterium]
MAEPLRVLIADDESMARKRLTRLLAAVPDVVVVGEATTGVEVLAALRAGAEVDLILLDIHMPDLTGVETLALLGPTDPLVVFTTAHADHAVQAFDGGAADYLLKPIEPGRLVKALDRARERLVARMPAARPDVGPVGGSTPGPSRIPVPTRKGLVLVDPADISHAVIDGESVVLVTRKGRFYTEFRLADLERRLPASFLRVHRQAVVNLDRIERLEDADSGGYLAVLDDGSAVPVSRQVARQLRRDWDLG